MVTSGLCVNDHCHYCYYIRIFPFNTLLIYICVNLFEWKWIYTVSLLLVHIYIAVRSKYQERKVICSGIVLLNELRLEVVVLLLILVELLIITAQLSFNNYLSLRKMKFNYKYNKWKFYKGLLPAQNYIETQKLMFLQNY